MSHWHTVDQLAAGRLADLRRDAAGDALLRAAVSADPMPLGDRNRGRGRALLWMRRLLPRFRSVVTIAFTHRRRDLQIPVAGWQPPGRNR